MMMGACHKLCMLKASLLFGVRRKLVVIVDQRTLYRIQLMLYKYRR